jgi:predicted NBD/HSP70 family sugar kinase
MYLAIDIGGTKTLLALFSTSGKMLASQKFSTPPNYPTFLEQLEKNISELKKSHPDGIEACVVGAPGKIDRANGVAIAFGNLPWSNVPIHDDIKKLCRVPVAVENDANLAGLSEAILITHSYRKVLYVTVSTGIGGGLIVDGIIDPDFADAEIGHMVFEHDGKIQRWEEFASGYAIFQKYGKKASDLDDPQAWYVISRNLALGLTNAINSLTPDVVVIGGGVGAHFEKFADPLHEALMLYGTSLVSVPPLRKAVRAEEAVIYGCYELARQIKK